MALQDRTASSSAFTRATVVIAIKYTIVERPQPIDAYIKPCIASFLLLITDEDRVSNLVSLPNLGSFRGRLVH
jgi:cullin-associated NEDD8-dissociated protein 1